MTKLEDLKPGQQIAGILPIQTLTIVDVQWHGEKGAAMLLAKMSPDLAAARPLAYRLYSVCERIGRASLARD